MKRLITVVAAALLLAGCNFAVRVGVYKQIIDKEAHYGVEVTGEGRMSDREFGNLTALIGSDGSLLVPVEGGQSIELPSKRREGETEEEWLKRITGGK